LNVILIFFSLYYSDLVENPNNLPEEYKPFEEEVKRRFPYAALKYHYRTPLWVINLLIRKY